MDKHQKALGEMPIKKLLFNMATPAIIGMLANSLYNIVDTIFLGQGVGAMAIAGVTIALPMQMIILAVSFLIAVGASSIISKRLGEKKAELAYLTAGNAFTLIIFSSILMSVLAFIFITPTLLLFGATPTIIPYANEYLSIILLGCPFFGFTIVANNIVRSTGNAKTAMITMILALGLNIILDPIFIFGSNMGIKGAAIATIISQIVGFFYILNFLLRGETSLKLNWKHFKLHFKTIQEIVKLGISDFIRQITFIILAIVIQNALKLYGGDIYIAVYGIINRIQMFIMMPLFGLAQAYQPITGFNYGAKQFNRVTEATSEIFKISTIYCTFFFLIMMLFPSQIINIFTSDSNAISLGVFALQLNVLLFPFFGLQLMGSTYFLAVGKAKIALFLTLSRQIIFLIPLVLFLPIFFQANGIWYSFPIADTVAIIITYHYMKKELNLLKSK